MYIVFSAWGNIFVSEPPLHHWFPFIFCLTSKGPNSEVPWSKCFTLSWMIMCHKLQFLAVNRANLPPSLMWPPLEARGGVMAPGALQFAEVMHAPGWSNSSIRALGDSASVAPSSFTLTQSREDSRKGLVPSPSPFSFVCYCMNSFG